jgi:hypothetical protein
MLMPGAALANAFGAGAHDFDGFVLYLGGNLLFCVAVVAGMLWILQMK